MLFVPAAFFALFPKMFFLILVILALAFLNLVILHNISIGIPFIFHVNVRFTHLRQLFLR